MPDIAGTDLWHPSIYSPTIALFPVDFEVLLDARETNLIILTIIVIAVWIISCNNEYIQV